MQAIATETTEDEGRQRIPDGTSTSEVSVASMHSGVVQALLAFPTIDTSHNGAVAVAVANTDTTNNTDNTDNTSGTSVVAAAAAVSSNILVGGGGGAVVGGSSLGGAGHPV